MEEEKEKKVSLKLLIDTKANKVLFAEVGKEFVDFLFHIMSLPVGTIINLLNVDRMVGSLGALYKSIESLSTDYLQPNLNKDSVLKPRAPGVVPLLSLKDTPTTTNTLYRCSNGCSYYTDCQETVCSGCHHHMRIVLNYVGPTGAQNNTASSSSNGGGSGGFVKGVVTYMVMDNLEVKPMSTISGITLMNKFSVKDVSSLEEKEVQVGLNEGIAMLKASLETNTVLSTIFLAKKI
ncbi:Netrin-G2 [Bienertia sinuspersici]